MFGVIVSVHVFGGKNSDVQKLLSGCACSGEVKPQGTLENPNNMYGHYPLAHFPVTESLMITEQSLVANVNIMAEDLLS